MKTKQIVYLVDDHLKDKPEWAFIKPLLNVPESELSVREKALMDKYWNFGCFYIAEHTTFDGGCQSLTSDLGSPEYKITIHFPKGVSEENQIRALKAAIEELV